MNTTLSAIITLSDTMDKLNSIMMNCKPMSENKEKVFKEWLATQELLEIKLTDYFNKK